MPAPQETEAVQPPACVAPLLEPLTALPGIGEATVKLLSRVSGGSRIIDLLFLMPENVIDRRCRSTIAALDPGQIVTLTGTVTRISEPAHRRQPWTVTLADNTGTLDIAFFSKWMAKRAVLNAAMHAKIGDAASWVGVDLGNDGYTVVRVNKVVPRAEDSAELRLRQKQEFERYQANAETLAYYEMLKERFKVQIKVARPAETKIS